MALNDFVLRIRPQAGDTAIHDEVTGTNVLQTASGSPVVSLVDTGSGVMAWQIVNGKLEGAVPAAIAALNLNAGSGDAGLTLVVRGRIVADQFGVSGLHFFSIGPDAVKFNGISVSRDGASNMQCNYGGVSASHTGAASTTLRTYVLVIRPNASGDTDHIRSWITTPGRVGTTHNAAATDGLRSGMALTTLMLGPEANNYTLQLHEVLIYRNAKTDAEAAQLADTADLQGIVGPGDTTPPVITGPGGATGATASIAVSSGATAVHTYTANEAVTWSLNGGANAALFSINPSTGALTYSSPATAGTHVVVVRATDAATPTPNATNQTLTVTVSAPAGGTITSSPLVRNTGANATDPWALWGPGQAFTAWVHHISTGALLVKRTGLLTNASGVLNFTDAAVPVASQHRVDFMHEATGDWGMEILPAT